MIERRFEASCGGSARAKAWSAGGRVRAYIGDRADPYIQELLDARSAGCKPRQTLYFQVQRTCFETHKPLLNEAQIVGNVTPPA